MRRLLLILGLALLLAGLCWPWLSRLPFGRLPGDISIERGNFSFHLPLTTCILVSLALTLLAWWLRR